ncbi:hypothetical protein [Flavobacterium sp. B17]|uniref:hypothetical protein n=1 Tax=Flavobacterium sp. B17 TaxID=95618 RepID=UPI000344B5E2|nr:hypothetical protein [Flavobacterium sp. B17]
MKNIITLAVLFISLIIQAQVGINNTSPKATLDITPKTTDGSKPEGLLIPQLDGNSLKTAAYGTAQKGVIVYAKSVASPTDAKTVNITAEGYYYFDGSVWQKMTGASAGDTTNDAWINDTTNGLVKLGTKADATARTAGTDFVAKDNGQIGIGTSSPDASAALEVASTNKGMLIPRVALTGSTDQTTIASPANGLMVYNMGTGGLTFKGFVFWNGTEWRSVNNNPTISPTIVSLNCIDSSTFPATFTSGTAYNGTLTVPYTGGNGGSYSSGTSFSQNGLTFTLNPDTLNYGNGSISYSISGTPNFTSPNTISLPLSFLGQSCNATVGENVSVNPIQSLKKVISPIPTTTDAVVQNATKTTFGNLSVRYGGLVANVRNTANSIQLSPSVTTQMTIWGELTGNGGTTTYTKQTLATVSANNWTGWNMTFNPYNRDQGRMLVSLHTTGEIYRITVLCNDDMTSPTTASNITFFIEKL